MKQFLLAIAMLVSLTCIAQSENLILSYVNDNSAFTLKAYDKDVAEFSVFWVDNYDEEPLGGKISALMYGGVQGVRIEWPKNRKGRVVDSISVRVIKKNENGAIIGIERFTVLSEGFITECGCEDVKESGM